MNTREQFGNYLLLKKLADDSLGETFRAGRIGKSGMESVVLIRVFNGPSIDGQALWQKVNKRAAVQQRLKSPNIGDGVDLGEVRNVPFVAYDYVSGKNLGNLLEQAARKHTPIPTDHALLISERVALGLAVAYENKIEDQRILHGFLVPEMVMLSNEGETRLLGFEVGQGLRDYAGKSTIASQFGRYLAPETLAGQTAHKSDDCYSLGAILFELLTSTPLPMPVPPEGYGPLIDRAELANEGTPINPELASLIKRSLTGRAERIPDVVTWHKMLAKLMFDGQYNPTTFNLAFFMHNLFRDEIERESQEIEVEKTIKLPVAQPMSQPAAPTGADTLSAGGVRDTTVSVLEQYGIEEKKKSNLPMMVAAAAAVVVIGVAAVMFLGGKNEAPAPAPVAAPVVPAGPTPEELAAQQEKALAEQKALEAQIAKLVEERLKNLTESARADRDKELQALQKQLEDARKAEEERQRQIAQAQAAAAQKAAAQAEAKPPEPARPATAAVTPAQAAPGGPSAAPATAPTAPATAPTQTAAAPASAPTASAPATAVAVPVAPPTAATAAAVKRGDLVGDGPGVKKPTVVERVNPRYPPMAERMKKQADVTVRVLVDENGKVTEVKAKDDPGFGFAAAAEDAARRSRFSAATKDGVPVKMWTEIKYSFKP